MKTVSVVVACCNEEGNVVALSRRIGEIFQTSLPEYGYQILFIDNDSKDGTRSLLRQLCQEDPEHICAIFNTHNMGSIRSSIYGMLQATGDCVVKMSADFQDPPELLVPFVRSWQQGHKIVVGIKSSSQESGVMRSLRKAYYRVIRKITDIQHIDNFVGYGLYDRDFIEDMRQADDPLPYFRGMVAEFGYKYEAIPYVQPPRRSGRSKFNFMRLYDYAMLGITSYSKVLPRVETFVGGAGAAVTLLLGIIMLIVKLVIGSGISVSTFFIINSIFFVGFSLLAFLGLSSEYLISINTRVMHRPMVIEEERINLPPREKAS